MNTIVIIFGFSVLFATIGGQRHFRQNVRNNNCYVPQRYNGYCATLSNCPSVAWQYSQYRRPDQGLEYLRAVQSSCGLRNVRRDPVVCCEYTRNGESPPRQEILQPVIATTTTTTTTTTRTTTTQRPTTQRPTTQSPTTQRPTIPRADVTNAGENSSCRGPDLTPGTCKPLADCPPLLTNYLQSNTENAASNRQFLKLSNEICEFRYSVVCCPTTTDPTESTKTLPIPPPQTDDARNQRITSQLPTVAQGCGLTKIQFKKIVGGETSKLGAWPWIALLGYETRLEESPFKCGGTMITVRHVLTAAHCIQKSLKFVRLGEHDLQTNYETKHVDINIAKVKVHEEFNAASGHSDIAILYLTDDAPITDLIRPVCLPTSHELRTKSLIGHNPFVVGWGKTQEAGKSATVLQQLQIPIYENAMCLDSYHREGRLRVQIDDGSICAGEVEGGKDTCQGDSGGPLLYPDVVEDGELRFFIIGVVSYGIGCARPNIPGVYTRVAHYIDWIEQKVADIN